MGTSISMLGASAMSYNNLFFTASIVLPVFSFWFLYSIGCASMFGGNRHKSTNMLNIVVHFPINHFLYEANIEDII